MSDFDMKAYKEGKLILIPKPGYSNSDIELWLLGRERYERMLKEE